VSLVAALVEEQGQWRALRRALHAEPELSGAEHRTAERVAVMLAAHGIAVSRGWAGTGVVGSLRRGSSERSIGLRADMDALPIQEANSFEHASRHTGVMHACGHDGHVAMLLAAACHLARAGRFDGQVHFICQPSEERGGGAQRMVAEGLFDRHPCDTVFALHNWPGLEAGHFGVRRGALMAGTAGLEIAITGRSAHAALPHEGVDAAWVACQVASALQGLTARERDPLCSSVLSITQLHCGDSLNVLAGEARLAGTLRAFDAAEFDRLEAGIERVASLVASAHRAQASVQVRRNYPPLVNNAVAVEHACAAMTQAAGAERVRDDIAPTMAAEDFAYLLQARPGCMAFIGNGAAAPGAGLHGPRYDFNDALLPVGASYFVHLVERLLPREGSAT
jgi:amidohydrolase